jgi:hypothetical protein
MATPQTTRRAGTFRTFRYPSTDERNPAFDGAAFVRSWARFVGSAHRHCATGELVLCWSTEGPHPQQRETLRSRLEARPANVGSVLAAVDSRDESFRRTIEAGAARQTASREG